MGQRDKEAGRFELSRRDFLKVSAAGATAAAMLDFAPAPAMAQYPLHGGDTADNMKTFHTTCPYCSASCGQIVAVGGETGEVYDIYGDARSPINNGGLCAKGAGAYQLVTNKRRLGVDGFPTDSNFASAVYPDVTDGRSNFNYVAETGDYASGVAYKRTGNGAWGKVALDTAMDDIAARMVAARGTVDAANGYNSKGVAFLGCSHMNNEQNYTYRKLIAQFGSSNTEHQARI